MNMCVVYILILGLGRVRRCRPIGGVRRYYSGHPYRCHRCVVVDSNSSDDGNTRSTPHMCWWTDLH